MRDNCGLVAAVEGELRAGATGASAATGVPAAISTRLFEGLAIGRLKKESAGAWTEGSAAQPSFSCRDADGSAATFSSLHSALGAHSPMNAAVQGSMTALHAAHAVRGAKNGAAGNSVRCSRQIAHSRLHSRTGAVSSSVRTAPCARRTYVPIRRGNARPSTTSSGWCTVKPAISTGAST